MVCVLSYFLAITVNMEVMTHSNANTKKERQKCDCHHLQQTIAPPMISILSNGMEFLWLYSLHDQYVMHQQHQEGDIIKHKISNTRSLWKLVPVVIIIRSVHI